MDKDKEKKDGRVNELIKNSAAKFLQRESNKTSLITVTKAEVFDKMRKAVIYITVLPESNEKEALDFTKRKRSDFREYLKDETRMRILPFIDFEIDKGEKSRQNIDVLLNK